MTRLERFIAKWLLRRIVRQGAHYRMIREFYTMLLYEFQDEFTEDNLATTKSFLDDRFAEAFKKLGEACT